MRKFNKVLFPAREIISFLLYNNVNLKNKAKGHETVFFFLSYFGKMRRKITKFKTLMNGGMIKEFL